MLVRRLQNFADVHIASDDPSSLNSLLRGSIREAPATFHQQLIQFQHHSS